MNADYFRRHGRTGLPWVVSKIVIDSPCSRFRFTTVVGSNEGISVRSNSAIDQIGVGEEQGHGGAFLAQAFNGPVEQGFGKVADAALVSGCEGFPRGLELRADLEVQMRFLFVRRHPPNSQGTS